MSKSFPYTPWYHGDFLRSTVGWTLLEQAVYWRLLCAQWDSGPLPNDMTRLASIAGTDVATVTAVWPVVGKKFKRTAVGLINKRMADHRRDYLEFRRRQSEGGKKGMASRWGNRNRDPKVVDIRTRVMRDE
jgi:uncharacterized protein YdaU (DUF1376 family)